MKKAILAVILIVITLLNFNIISAVPAVTVKVDGKAISFPDAQPFINSDDRTMVPVRFVSEALGASVDWAGSIKLVTIKKVDKLIKLRIGDNWAIANDSKKEFDTASIIKYDRTFVPLRFISELLGAGVTWDGSNNTVLINTDGSAPVADSSKNDSPYEDFVLTQTNGVKPEGYITPQFRVVHTPDDYTTYFEIQFVNFWDYKDNNPGEYSYKTEYINAPKLNKQQGPRPDGTPGYIINLTNTVTLDMPFKAHRNPNAPVYIRGLPRMYYTTYEWEADYKITKGMELQYRITFTKGSYKEIYEKVIKVRG